MNLCKSNTCLNWTNSPVPKGFCLDRFYFRLFFILILFSMNRFKKKHNRHNLNECVNLHKPHNLCVCPNDGIGFPTSHVVCLCSVSSVKMRSDRSFCWYWWNWWTWLLKLSFHNLAFQVQPCLPYAFCLATDRQLPRLMCCLKLSFACTCTSAWNFPFVRHSLTSRPHGEFCISFIPPHN